MSKQEKQYRYRGGWIVAENSRAISHLRFLAQGCAGGFAQVWADFRPTGGLASAESGCREIGFDLPATGGVLD